MLIKLTIICGLIFSLNTFSAEIKFIPFRISTYTRVTIENIDDFCVSKGEYELRTLQMLSPSKCLKKPDYKINLRAYIFHSPEKIVLIDQGKRIWLNNFECSLTKDETNKITSEIEHVMKNKKRICKDTNNN